MRTTLDQEAQHAIADQLQPLVVQLADLALTGKQLHWNVTGPNFRSLHLQLDEFVDAWRTWTDQVAERLSAIGVPPDGRAGTIATQTPMEPVAEGWIEDRKAITLLADRIQTTAKKAREAMGHLDRTDLGSQDVLIEVVAGLEEQLWMLSTQE